MEVALLESGDRRAREHWQQVQLQNLVQHATQRSGFWRNRIGNRRLSYINLSSLPMLTRQDVRQQVALEGPCAPAGMPTDDQATSGSSGIPVHFFVTGFNGLYNEIRSLAQYFMEGRDLSLNHTRVRQTVSLKEGISVETHRSWMGPLALFIKSGTRRTISLSAFATDRQICRKLVEELKKADIGYLICSPRNIEMMSMSFDLEFLKATKTAMWIPFGEHLSTQLMDYFANLSIPIRGNYSAEEVGLIGAECSTVPGYYHVATSNVIVELVDRSHDIEGVQVGKLLVTHLHSYATPFIRYDVGDLACLSDTCPCGHDGPSIYNLQGRFGRILKHRDGRLSPLHVTGRELATLADFTEYRMRQTAFDKIVIEIGGRSELSSDEVAAVTSFLKQRAGEEFSIEVKPCSQIDWGKSRKRPGFRCEI
jgi:phenylacetate-coenzyme A ligase PaaK-like adenylate-forming protein